MLSHIDSIMVSKPLGVSIPIFYLVETAKADYRIKRSGNQMMYESSWSPTPGSWGQVTDLLGV